MYKDIRNIGRKCSHYYDTIINKRLSLSTYKLGLISKRSLFFSVKVLVGTISEY